MNNIHNYKRAIEYIDLFCSLMNEYVKANIDPTMPGYIQVERAGKRIISIVIADIKYTLYATINPHSDIVFDVYKSTFDLSTPNGYSSERIDELAMRVDIGLVKFVAPQTLYSSPPFETIIMLGAPADRLERFFEVFEFNAFRAN